MRGRTRAAAAFLVAALATLAAPAAAQDDARVNAPHQRGKPYVVLVSLDGFRADYLDTLRGGIPNLERLARRGVRARGLVPVFPSKTFPNHYSLVTGLSAEHHGIVANAFWDPRRRAAFGLGDRASVRDGSWYGGAPIWVLAERQGMLTAPYFWPGSEGAVAGVRPAIARPYDGSVPDSTRVDSLLAWLRLPAERRPHLLSLYLSRVDDAGHRSGPHTPEVARAASLVDGTLGRLLDGIDATPLRDSTFVVVVSDHGMAPFAREHFEAIDRLVDTAGVRVADAGPNANLHVSGGAARARAVRDALNRGLRHGRAYLRRDVPRRLHYRADPRIGDVVVVMELPYQVGLSSRAPRASGGAHGWDPARPEMHGIFLAAGPGVRAGAVIPAFSNLDVYPFLAELLGLRIDGRIDGARGRLRAAVLRGR